MKRGAAGSLKDVLGAVALSWIRPGSIGVVGTGERLSWFGGLKQGRKWQVDDFQRRWDFGQAVDEFAVVAHHSDGSLAFQSAHVVHGPAHQAGDGIKRHAARVEVEGQHCLGILELVALEWDFGNELFRLHFAMLGNADDALSDEVRTMAFQGLSLIWCHADFGLGKGMVAALGMGG